MISIEDFKARYNDNIIARCVLDAVVAGVFEIANKDSYSGETAHKIKMCAQDMRNLSFKDFVRIIKTYFS